MATFKNNTTTRNITEILNTVNSYDIVNTKSINCAKVYGLATPTDTTDAVTKTYAETNFVSISSGVSNLGNININGTTNVISATDIGGDITLSSEATGDLKLKSRNVEFTWPNGDGSINQVLTTNSSGILSWTSTGSGDVSASSNFTADNRIVRTDGNSGKIVQQSGITIDDNDIISGVSRIDIDTNMRLDGNTISAINVDGGLTLTPNGVGNLTLNSVIISSANVMSGVTQLNVDNLRLDGNSITSTDSGGDINITPNTTGSVNLHSVSVSSADVVSGVTQLNVDNLRLDGNSLTSTDSGGDINITPDTTGNVVIDGQTWPNALGSNTNILQTDASGNLSWVAIPVGDVTAASSFGTDELMIIADGTGKGVQSVNLSVVQTGSDTVVTNTSSGGDLTMAANATGDLKLTSKGVTYTMPTADGSNGFVLQTNGSGTMSWVSVAGAGDVTAASTFGVDELMIISDGTGKGVQSVNLSVVQTGSDTVVTNTSSGGDLTMAANATGDLKLTSKGVTYTMPTADGSSGFVLQTNGTGTLSWVSVAGVGDVTAASNFGTDNAMIIADGTGKGVQSVNLTVTQLGVDTTIANTSTDGDITLTPNGAGNLVLDGQTWPNALGSNGQVLQTDASGNLSWTNAGAGDVTAASNFGTDNVLIRSDGTGKGVQSSGISINDSDVVSGVTQLDVDNLRMDANTVSSTSGNLILSGVGNDVQVISNSITYTWPTADGSSGQVIQTNGSGTLSFGSVTADLDQYTRTVVNSATYTLLETDFIIGVTYTATGAVTLTLPQISSITGNKKRFVIKDEGGNATTNNITINRSGSDTIDGDTSKIIAANYTSIALYNDGSTGWFIM